MKQKKDICDNCILKPFDQKSAKKPIKRRKSTGPQASLFGVVRPGRRMPGGQPVTNVETSFREIAGLWLRGVPVPAEKLPAIQGAARELSSALTRRLGDHYSPLKKQISNALDVAAYFVLREAHEKAEKEVPDRVLEALDFSVASLKSKR